MCCMWATIAVRGEHVTADFEVGFFGFAFAGCTARVRDLDASAACLGHRAYDSCTGFCHSKQGLESMPGPRRLQNLMRELREMLQGSGACSLTTSKQMRGTLVLFADFENGEV